ncbi:MAG: sugar nucleotide-binding protein [Clostridia bacterium]|nr:sugar nucleotide-binding protein [Clostridia bacterium]
MKFLVLGCNGMAGHTISLYLKEKGHDVLGFDLRPSDLITSVAGDAMNAELIKDLVGKNKFDTVINCIGILNQFAEKNKAVAVYLNSFFPHYLAQLTEGTDTQVIHMSTDCVFSGNRGHYKEDDLRDGTTFYDRSKALGEIENEKDLTLRQSIVGPDINPKGIGLLNWFMQQHGEVSGYTGAMWTGQTTLQLAKTMETAAKEKVHGLYNMVPDTSISKYGLLLLFNQYIRKEKITVIPSDKITADKSLERTRWDFTYAIPDYEIMVSELSGWMKDHRSLYPHYGI